MYTEPHNLIANLLSDLEQTAILLQSVLLAISLALSWGAVRLLRSHLPPREGSKNWTGLTWCAFPLIALLLVMIGKAVLEDSHSTHLLDIAIPLLTAMTLLRLTLYALRQVFAPSRWLEILARSVAAVVWIAFALHLTGLLPRLINALDDIGFHAGKQYISLLAVLTGILSVLVTMLLALWASRALEHKVMAAQSLDPSLRIVMSKLIRTALIVLGVLIALPLAGIDITVLSVFGGALGVGIGLGLQKIASNYVSGFIILLDHSIRPGDLLTVDGRFGKVTQMTSRYLVLKSSDGTEAIIPNETLVSSTVINHSYSDPQVKVAIPVQIGYQSNVDQAMAILLRAATNQPRVLADPAPETFLKSFDADGITLELGFWINDPEAGQLGLTSAIRREIWQEFQQAGIEIPFPQRDVRIINSTP
ncbi:MAG: mechanosensitive ion channel [Gallionellaceae bacterium]|jgi:small-conductance mechanosensitive channel|nr:mechanosensitive ion channel [Gallionellaceae bacterium]